MNWVVMLFCFTAYAIVVLTSTWFYEKFFKKGSEKCNWETCIQVASQYPKIVLNTYLLREELASKIMFLLFFLFGVLISLSPVADSLSEFYRRMALGTACFGVVFTLLTRNKVLFTLMYTRLNICEYKEYFTYEYVTEKGEIKVDEIPKNQICSITWSFLPYASKDRVIWLTELEDDSKRWAFVFSPFYFLITMIYWLIFWLLNGLNVRRYLLIRTQDGVFSVPREQLLLQDNVNFEWRSLINRFITNGGNYAE